MLTISNLTQDGATLTHNNTLKVGDIIPISLKYDDIEINTKVKIVKVSEKFAQAEFFNLSEADANQILYLSMMHPEQPAVNVTETDHEQSISATNDAE